MVWFQCEVCGDNLKKPKLPGHFRICSAYKLSCIDCGEIFDRQSVQGHNQCITEAEKYGPKGQGKVANGTPAKANKDKPKPDVDINVGLSERPPWFCSLCNTKATSKETLLGHANGKKHRAKARAHAAAQQPKPSEEPAPINNNDTTENATKNGSEDDKSTEDRKENGPSNGALISDNSVAENGNASSKKRKVDLINDDSTEKPVNGKTEVEGTPKKVKKAKHEAQKEDNGVQTGGAKKEGSGQKIKWKKLITTALKSTPDGVLKMKKLRKVVNKSLHEFGIAVDDSELSLNLEEKVKSSSKFTVDGKYVRLAAKCS